MGGVARAAWTPELKVRGTVALAPVSHLAEQLPLLQALTQPGGLSGLAAMILRGIDAAAPQLGVAAGLERARRGALPADADRVPARARRPDAFGGVAPAELLRPDVDTAAIATALAQRADPDELKIRTPVRIQQGADDATVFKAFTDQLAAGYSARREAVTYKTYPGVDHGGAVTNARSARDATRYIRSRLR